LHEVIAARFDAMLAAGLVAEVAALRARHALTQDMPSMRCVGYPAQVSSSSLSSSGRWRRSRQGSRIRSRACVVAALG